MFFLFQNILLLRINGTDLQIHLHTARLFRTYLKELNSYIYIAKLTETTKIVSISDCFLFASFFRFYFELFYFGLFANFFLFLFFFFLENFHLVRFHIYCTELVSHRMGPLVDTLRSNVVDVVVGSVMYSSVFNVHTTTTLSLCD